MDKIIIALHFPATLILSYFFALKNNILLFINKFLDC
jgi:hypothetical protein